MKKILINSCMIFILIFICYPLKSQWEPIQGNLNYQTFQKLQMIWSHKDKLYAQFSGKIGNGPYYKAIYYSTDYGDNWMIMTEFDSVATVGIDKNKIIIHQPDRNLKYSTDGGNTWSERDTLSKIFYYPRFVFQEGNIWAGNGRGIGIYLSTDYGYSWLKKHDGTNPRHIFDMDWYDNYIYVGSTTGFTLTSDMGNTWINTESATNYEIRKLKVFGNRIFIATRINGFLVSTDMGTTWKETGKGLPKFKDVITQLVINRGLIFVTIGSPYILSQDRGGIFVSADSGETFRRIVFNLPGAFAYDICFQDEYIFTNIVNDYPQGSAGVYRSRLDELLATLDVEIKRKEASKQFYASAPYPTPSHTFVKSRIYWNVVYDIKNAEIFVSDIYGNKIFDNDISIIQTEINSAEIIWDCSKVHSGLYFIAINYLGDTKTIPVLVIK